MKKTSIKILLVLLCTSLLCGCGTKKTELKQSLIEKETIEKQEQTIEKTSPKPNINSEKLLVEAELLCSDFSDCQKAKESLELLDRCILEDRDFIEAYELRSIALSTLAYYDEAFDDITYVIRKRPRTDPKLSQSYTRRAYIHEKLGNLIGAKKDLENAEKLKTKKK